MPRDHHDDGQPILDDLLQLTSQALPAVEGVLDAAQEVVRALTTADGPLESGPDLSNAFLLCSSRSFTLR